MSAPAPKVVEIVEVGLRDGLQSIVSFVETQRKIDLLQGLYSAGLRRMEVSSFVSASAVPQMADAAEVLCAALRFRELDAHVLVPTARHARRALDAGAFHLAFVLSVSPWHNNANVRRTPLESIEEFRQIVELAPRQTRFRVNVATAFDCPRLGRVGQDDVLQLLSAISATSPEAEIALCDTTGRATPCQVSELFMAAHGRCDSVRRWAFHGHDTYGMGAANAMAAWHAGVSVIDASVAGLGGCPFAPGATGNTATEDLVWMFENMGIDTGVDLDELLKVAAAVVEIPGAQTGGRVRGALSAASRLTCTTT
jgi:hydroxymethylglutaryl-CoA lyase